MTVQELISKLECYPPGMRVFFYDDDGYPIEVIRVDHEVVPVHKVTGVVLF